MPPCRDAAVGDRLARLAPFQVTRYVRVVSESPMTGSGEIQKFKLREEHQKILAS
jgi:acyl-CoA synthetase (AMP-forming)/AMP-acid ligase II